MSEFKELGTESPFCQKLIRDLGLIKYAEDIQAALYEELLEAYGEEHLDGLGLTYHDVEVFHNGNFLLDNLECLKKDKEKYSSWKSLIKKAKVSICHHGMYSSLECDWNFLIDIGTTSNRLLIEVWLETLSSEIGEGKVKAFTLYRKGGEDYEKELVVFLLRYT